MTTHNIDTSMDQKCVFGGTYHYAYCRELQDVLNLLVEGEYELSEWEKNFVLSLSKYGTNNGYLTYKQMRVLGGISKQHIHGGVYVHRDWWDGTIKAIRFHKNEMDVVHEVLAQQIADEIDRQIITKLSNDSKVLHKQVPTASEFRRRFGEKLAERASLRFSNVEDECSG